MLPAELSRQFILLNDSNKFKKKAALRKITEETTDKLESLSPEEVKQLADELSPHIVNCLLDDMEKIREDTSAVFIKILSMLQDIQVEMKLILPIIYKQIGQEDCKESSEEIRLKLMEIHQLILSKGGKSNEYYGMEHCGIVKAGLLDHYQEVKKIACQNLRILSVLHGIVIYQQGEMFVKPLITCMAHQHSRVRVEAVTAAHTFFMHCQGKYVEEFLPHIAQRFFDQSPQVRRVVVETIGAWLLDLPDRYSYHPKLIPLLFTGFHDNNTEILQLAQDLWHDIGLKYEKENEQDLKMKADFSTGPPAHYPANLERPNLGCRTLIERNLSKILPAICNDLTDWVEGTRAKAAQLLPPLLLNAETHVTQHAHTLVLLLAKSMSDESATVRRAVEESTHLAAHFLEPSVWWKLLSEDIKLCQSSGGRALAARVGVLAQIVRGSDTTRLWDSGMASEVIRVLAEEDLAQSADSWLKLNCVLTVENLLFGLQTKLDSNTENATASVATWLSPVQRPLLYILLCILGIQAPGQEPQVGQALTERCRDAMDMLARLVRLDSRLDLFRLHMPELLKHLHKTCSHWLVQSGERLVFDALVLESGPILAENMQAVLDVLEDCLQVDKPPEFKLKFFLLLARLFVNAGSSTESHTTFESHLEPILSSLLLPNMVWRAGRTAEAVRKISLTCLWTLLNTGRVEPHNTLDPLLGLKGATLQEVVSRLVSLLDEEQKDVRKMACQSLQLVMDRLDAMPKEELAQNMDLRTLHNLYPNFIKRMDDAEDENRILTTELFLAWFRLLRADFDPSLYRGHLEEIYRGLLIHLDDTNSQVQEAVLRVLHHAGQLDRQLLTEEVNKVRHKHRTDFYCNKLLEDLLQRSAES